MKKITIIGSGYVGLVTGACLAEQGNQVICLDIDKEKVASLRAGNIPFYEPGLEELVVRCVKAKRLSFSSSYEETIPGQNICFLALPTPSDMDGACDIQYVLAAAKQLAEVMDNYLVIVNKSTVPVGTAMEVKNAIRQVLDQRCVEIPFDVVSNPEFLREGNAIHDSRKPNRIVIGAESKKAMQEMSDLYRGEILFMDIASAELTKYAANAMLASRISFINSIAQLAEKVGANIQHIRRAIGMDDRIGHRYLKPGIGFGGSCLPKDVKALRALSAENGVTTPFLDAILAINDRQIEEFFQKVESRFETLSGKTIAIWGLSFKPDTDDLRDAPSLALIEKFAQAGASLRVYDPQAIPRAKILLSHYEDIHFCSSEYEAAIDADAICLITEWKQFQFVDFERIGANMRQKILFDGRNQYSEANMMGFGFEYTGIGIAESHAYAY